MNCERCGHEISPNTTICPDCGTVKTTIRPSTQPPTSYGIFPQSGFGEPSSYVPPSQTVPYPTPEAKYHPTYQHPLGYMAGSSRIRPGTSSSSDSALITQVLLSLIGIFGIGWLMARQTAIGIILLIFSLLIYYPIVFLGTGLTRGLGLICLGPLAIGIIILNAIFLSNRLHRKTTRSGALPPRHRQ